MVEPENDYLENIKSVFFSLTKDAGEVEVNKVPEILNACGLFCSEAEIKGPLAEADLGYKENLNFEDFVIFLKQLTRVNEPKNNFCQGDLYYIELCEVFDKGKLGIILPDHFREVLNKLGEKLTDEEVNEIIQRGNPKEEKYIKYVDYILNQAYF